jgi:hypothetical protein
VRVSGVDLLMSAPYLQVSPPAALVQLSANELYGSLFTGFVARY